MEGKPRNQHKGYNKITEGFILSSSLNNSSFKNGKCVGNIFIIINNYFYYTPTFKQTIRVCA